MVAQRSVTLSSSDDPSSPGSVPPRPSTRLRSDEADIVSVTIIDLLAGIRIHPVHRFAPYPGSERTCAWCGRVETTPDPQTGTVIYHTDGICLPCLLNVQLFQSAGRHRVILLPDRILDDETMPIRWRLFGYLQREGAGAMWIELRATQLAAKLCRQPRTIYRVLAQLERDGYLIRRTRKMPHQRPGLVRELRLSMGGGGLATANTANHERR